MSTALAPAPPADATRLLYEQYSSRIFGFCLSRLGSREEAEDAVQTTFLNAQRGLRRGVVPQYELAWLFKIAQNVCHNRHQSARRRGRLEAAQDLDALQDVLATPERGSAVSLGDLTRALSAVPDRQRRALLLREVQGFSYEEIALELGVSVGAVETLIFRGRRSVAAQLENLGATPRRSGAVASVVELFRWFFQGGAAPIKLAAAAATVATTAALAVVPAVHQHATRLPTGPKRVTGTKVVPTANVPRRVVRSTVRTSSARPPAVHSGSTGSALPPPAVHAGSTAVRTDSPPSTVLPAASTSAATLPVPPVPQIVIPPALPVPSVDPGLLLPTVTLPTVSLPDVQLTPPALPKLP